jgi:hypothetical protein
MRIEDLLRSSLPLAYKFIAVVVAVATATGLYAFLRYREVQLASAASLSFDSAVAQQLDSTDKRVRHPAVVLGQSILSDSVIATLIPQADLAASSTADAIGEFRTHLELTQPNAGLLRVRYRDPDPAQAVAAANAVANALAAWSPSTTSAPGPAANAQTAPASGPKPVPASAAAPQHAAVAEPSLAAALRELQAQLSAADQQAFAKSSSQSEHDRQRHLESQVRAAQQKLNDLRKEFAHSGSASGGQARMDAIEQALAHFWPSTAGLSTAGTSEAQLAYEREQLTRDIGAVEQQQQAAQRSEAANSALANRPTQQTVPLASQPQPASAGVISPPVSGVATNPFHPERMAGLPAPVAWWPSAVIGCFCGLLWWGFAFLRYRSSSESDDFLDLPEESARSANRLLNIEASIPADSHEEWIEAYPAKTSSAKRASFTFDPESISEPVPNQSPSPESPSPEPIQSAKVDTVPVPVPDNPTEPAESPTDTAMAQAPSAADAAAPPPVPAPEEQDRIFHEKFVEATDPWEEEIRKNLLQTTIARMLDPQIAAEDIAPAKGPASDAGPPTSEPDRLTG